MGERPRLELFAGLASLYRSRDYSDLTISGRDGTRHSVHRAIVCPRSDYFQRAVQERRWRDGIEGHLALPEEDEVVRLMIEYLYLLDYDPTTVSQPEDSTTTTTTAASSSYHDSSSSSDTMSIRTEPGQYGHVYGTSAISAFGGPAHHHAPPPFPGIPRPRTESSLTVHALPTTSPTVDFVDFYHHNPQQQHPRRRNPTARGTMVTAAPSPSPLATKQPHLVLHARIYSAAAKYSIGGLKTLALDKFKIQRTRHWDSPEFPEAIHVVYSSTPATDKDMREAMADTLGWHGSLLDKPEVEVAIMEINGLAYELLKRSRRAEPEYE
ncbi:hypothetical protein AC578_3782 [Lecanosticta acicola]|uniref:BTB domain-containing protein n=1 Tax=Lecanosticta acicola TaxID=111012 RepID=A0AAI9EG56_9PEZI|nr:hypothetical protein AC578_3782 [Lecanosticta acicola]